MMLTKVFFTEANAEQPLKSIHQKLATLFDAIKFDHCITKNDFVAIKTHFGEAGNTTHIPANYFSPLIEKINNKNAKPFFIDTCVLYKSQRSDAISHLGLAEQHGFSLNQTGIPVIIADGLRGRNEIEIKIKGKLFDSVAIAAEAVFANAMVVTSHVTGHIACGLGGAIKNMGMGLASRKGKLRQHSSVKPWIEISVCTGCGECIRWCPENAIHLNDDVAGINKKLCVGCGECLTACHFGAVRFNWKTSSADLQKKMAEHALGAVQNKMEKTCYFNFLINMTRDCDCLNSPQKPIINDIGILASKDPVAIDKASLDIIENRGGKSLTSLSNNSLDPMIQLAHAQQIGLGKLNYELITL
ncbi:MAG: DUF362 domain-containing protein [bacterium]|nr:DUF362 domain-containing protein [bacterium]